MSTITVEIAVRDDPRLVRAVRSLRDQTRRPDHILLVATPETPAALVAQATAAADAIPVETLRVSGGVVDARQAGLAHLPDEVTAFLDTDEEAPPEWLGRLVAPIEAGRAAFAGGPTRPAAPPETPIERYQALIEASIYEDLVPAKLTYLPLQNTAWRTADLRRLGFDPRIPFAEDHDLEVRAQRAGLAGEFVPDAWVRHDKSDETSYYRWARKRYRYNVALAMSMIKNDELRGRVAERRRPIPHRLRFVEAAMKPVALAHAALRWRRVAGRRVPAP